GQDVPHIKRVLELNPTHPLVTALQKAHSDDPGTAELSSTAEILYGMALLAEGGELAYPSRFIRLLGDRLARTL
ncbi:MAG: molecular chaperone HtpG, partial [Pseudonocardiaceae bacterium]